MEVQGVKSSQSDRAQQSFQALGFHNPSALDDGGSCGNFSDFALSCAADLEGWSSARQYFERNYFLLSLSSPCQVYRFETDELVEKRGFVQAWS